MRFLKNAILCLSLGLLAAGCASMFPQSGPAKLIPREVIFGNPEKASPVLAPDGDKLAWLAPANGVMNIWVRRLIGKPNERVVTSDTLRGIHGFRWQFDNRHILYEQDTNGDENTRLYQASIAQRGAAARCLTPWPGVKSGLLALAWRKPEEALIVSNRRDRRLMDVYRMNLFTGDVTTDTLNPGNVSGWIVDEDLNVAGFEVKTPDAGTEIWLRGGMTKPFRLWQRWGADDANGGVAGFSPAGTKIYYSSSVGSDATRLYQMDLETSRPTLLAKGMGSAANSDLAAVLRDPRYATPLAAQFFGARREWVSLNSRIAADFNALAKFHEGDVNIASQSLDDARWIVQYVVDDGPVYYYLYDRLEKKMMFLFANRPELEKCRLAKMTPIEFTARDGLKLSGYLSLPPWMGEKPATPPPMVIEAHGGPWSRDVWGYNPSTQWLANRGYAVLKINFRGSSGLGKRLMNAGDREWGGKMLDDLVDGKRWAVAQGYADPGRVAIMGGSYGGYAALAGAAFTPDEFACALSAVGPSSLITLMNSIPPYWEPERAVFNRRVGRLTETEFLKARSPLYHVDRIRIPLLIGQGANDPRVKQAESDQIVAALRQRGCEVEYLLFPDEGHGFLKPENRIKYYAAAEAFLAKHLGGRCEPAPESAVKP